MLRGSQLLHSEGWLEGRPMNQDPSLSLCLWSCADYVLGGGPGEVKTYSQLEVGIKQASSLEP